MNLTKFRHPESEAVGHGDIPCAGSSAAETSQQADLFGSGERILLPHERDLLEYERIAPGTSEWIAQFIEARRVRHHELAMNEGRRRRNAVFAKTAYVLILIALSLCASWYCLREGAPVSGAIMGVTALTLLTCFSLFSRDERKESAPTAFPHC